MKSVLHFFTIYLFVSCSNRPSPIAEAERPQVKPIPPQVTFLANLPDSLQPKITFLKDVPPPIVTAGNILPTIKPAGFTAHMKAYTTEQGLALDGVRGAATDHLGNLWFGTGGGGVSRYDGKSFITFTTAEGLANNLVWNVTEDHSGNLWFATYGGGVSRYDGKSFTTFSVSEGLASEFVFEVMQDHDGNFWFGCDGGGVCKYNGNRFIDFSIPSVFRKSVVSSIIEDRSGNIWFGIDGGGVSRYSMNRSNRPCNDHTCSHDLQISSDCEIHQQELARSFTTFTVDHGLTSNLVRCMVEDHLGNLWFGTNGGGLIRYDVNRANHPCINNICKHDLSDKHDLEAHHKEICKSFTGFTTAEGLPNNSIQAIAEDYLGNLWLGTNGGVSRYDGKSFTNFTTEHGLTSNIVMSITEDHAGNLWFGTDGGGITRYDGASFINFSAAGGLGNNFVMSITEDQLGNLWFGTEGGGVSRYDEKFFTSFTTDQGLANNFVRCVTKDKSGNLWFGTKEGVIRYNGKSFTNFTMANGLPHRSVWNVTEDQQGNLWFGTHGGGVSRYDGTSFTNFTSRQGLPNNFVRVIVSDHQGNLWFGSYGGGVSRYDGKSIINFSTDQGLINNFVFNITEDREGNILVGTQGGLSVFSNDQLSELSKISDEINSDYPPLKNLITNYTIEDGLPDNNVTQIQEHVNGKIYLGTNAGICELIGTGVHMKTGRIFNSSTGFPLRDVNIGKNAMFIDSKGIIWAGTSSEKTALVRFDPSALCQSNEPPQTVIQSLRVNEENICWYNLQSKNIIKTRKDGATAIVQEFLAYGKASSDSNNDSMLKKFGTIRFDSISSFYPLPQNLVLPHRHNRVSFEYASIEPAKPQLVKYQYMLEGYDKNWSPVTKNTNATFGNLYGGNYTFKLKSQGPNGIWSEPVSYSFTVLPAWYRTWWFYLLMAISLTGITYSIYRFRINQLLKVQAVRNRIATDLHDDIGSTLNSISIYSEVVKKELGKPSRSLDMIGESSRKIIDAMSDIVWTINPENDNFENIMLRMRSLAYNLLRAKNIEFTFHADESLNQLSLPMEVRKNFYMIFKEALNNIVKYSKAVNVAIVLSKENNAVKLLIQDDGVGFDSSNHSHGNGLSNMKKRAAEMKAEINIASGINEGVKIELNFRV